MTGPRPRRPRRLKCADCSVVTTNSWRLCDPCTDIRFPVPTKPPSDEVLRFVAAIIVSVEPREAVA